LFSRRAFALVIGLASLGVGPASAQPKPVEVTIEHFAFTPADAAVAVGGTIVFVNKDIVPHTATAADNSWTTGEIAHGASAGVTLPRNAAADFFCRFHPEMKGHLTIVPPR
jgi:plastocyanin